MFPALVVWMDRNERVETLMTAMLDNRKFVKNTVQKIYEEEIKTRCSYMNISGEVEKLRMLDSAKSYFQILQRETQDGLEINDDRNITYISISGNP